MALSDYRINSFTKPVSALDDKPQMSAAQLKEWFDSNSTKELKESVNGLIDELGEVLSGKVDTADGKDLSSNDYTDEDKAKVHEHANKAVLDKITAEYTTAEKTKLSGIEEGANKYTPPESHSADMITETASKRFTSDTELSGKVDTADGKGLSSNDYTDEDKAKVHTHANKAILDAITDAPIPDAPSDSSVYGRKNGAWSKIVSALPTVTMAQVDVYDRNSYLPRGIYALRYDHVWDTQEIYGEQMYYEYDLLIVSDYYNAAEPYTTQMRITNEGKILTRAACWYDSTASQWDDWSAVTYAKSEINTALNAKIDKVTGKGLSSNDYTDEDKAKVDKIDTLQSAVNVISDKVFRESPKTWADVQSIVRAGLANEYFSIGDQLTCSHDTYGTLTWDIIGIDCETPADTTKTHSLTLQLHRLCTTFAFDASEALYYADTELAAGTYNFTLLSGYDTAYGGGKTYQFTLANAVPSGGQIMFPWKYNTQAADTKISTYASKTSLTPIETVSVTEGSGGTALTSTNHTHCVRYGSNRWSKSLVRQWLNSTADAGAWWTSQSNYDRPIERVNTEAGFLKGINADFLSVIGSVKKSTAKNQTTEGGGAEILDEKIFLPSAAEVYGTNGGSEGNPYPYYSQNSSLSSAGNGADTNRIKYLGGTAEKWWLRSCHQFSGNYMRHVTVTGAIETNNPPNSYGITPVCAVV